MIDALSSGSSATLDPSASSPQPNAGTASGGPAPALKGDQIARSQPQPADVYAGAAKLGLIGHETQAADAVASSGHAGGLNAATLIAQETNPTTGQIDTQRLAAYVADAANGSFAKASSAYADIKSALQQHSPGDAQRFDDAVSQAFARGATDTATGVSTGLSSAGKSLLVRNPILSVQWESTQSAWTGKGGFTKGLSDLLDSHGINVAPRVNQPPVGSLQRTSGVPQAQANNTNGALARDAIANRYAAQGHSVQTEVARPGGGRRVDVSVQVNAPDPRNNQRIDIESKVGRTSLSPEIAAQASKDGEALAANAAVRATGTALELAGKVMLPVAIAGDAVQLGQAFHADGNKIGEQTGRAAGSVAGSWAGAMYGAEAGAAIGSVVPGVGTVVGGVVGGIAGGLAGSWLGSHAVSTLESLF